MVKTKTSEEYLYYAFSENEIRNRNDFLILGMYKLIYEAFAYSNNHTFAATQYDKSSMIKLYETLQVIRWKVRTNKDKNNQYLLKLGKIIGS